MERQALAFTILAIASLCAALGLFESPNGALILTPFLTLMLPLICGFDPAAPAVEKLIGILRLARLSSVGRSLPLAQTETHPLHGRIVANFQRGRAPPLPVHP